MMYLTEKHQKFVPSLTEPKARAEVMNWLMWQMGSGPYFGQFGHFYRYAPKEAVEARDYAVARYEMEVQRCLSVLDLQLAKSKSGYLSDWGYSIADMAVWPWVWCLSAGYKAKDFLSVEKYKHVDKWFKAIEERDTTSKSIKITSSS